MYWKDRAGKVHLITEMSDEYLLNCKKMLDRTDLRIDTLSKPSSEYAYSVDVTRFKDEYEFKTEYSYINSLEYYCICAELDRRKQ